MEADGFGVHCLGRDARHVHEREQTGAASLADAAQAELQQVSRVAHLLGDVGDDARGDEIQVFDLFARMAGLGEEGFDQFVGYAYAR